MGKDLFDKTDATKTRAQQMEAGIKEILGPSGAIILKYDESEKQVMLRDPKRAAAMFKHRREQLAGQLCIALKPIYFERTDGWAYVRDLLRFLAVTMVFKTTEEKERVSSAGLQNRRARGLRGPSANVARLKPEVLPKLVLWKRCTEAERCIKEAQKDTTADDNPSRVSRREDDPET